MKINTEKLPKIGDFDEYELFCQDKLRARVLISKTRQAIDKRDVEYYLELAKNKFEENILNNGVILEDKLCYCFFAHGDFTKSINGVSEANIKARVSSYGTDRLHIEIPKDVIEAFASGDIVSIIK